MCHFELDSLKRVRIGLNVEHAKFNQQAFQFAHELCHAIAAHGREGQRHDCKHKNHWFEEAICETASLFALRRMSCVWEQDSLFQTWRVAGENPRPYSKALSEYAQNRIENPENQLPRNRSLADWLQEHEQDLRDNPIAYRPDKATNERLRQKYNVVASQLLPLFEQYPEGWDSVSYLNLAQARVNGTLFEHFRSWETACPPKLHAFVLKIVATFEQ